jgi:3-oxoacyl-[acyl-carrier protein] reductase
MMQDVSSMSVLVTGGGSGLGAGIASHLARLGAKVTITGRRLDRLQEVAAAIGSQCAIVEGDVTDDADRRRMIDVAVAHGGGLQGLVNTAGNMLRGPITDLAAEDIAALLNTNCRETPGIGNAVISCQSPAMRVNPLKMRGFR